jgi:hypothetical protein
MAAAAKKPHTALDRERAGIVVVCAIRRQTAGGDHRDAITRVIQIFRLIESKLFPEVNGGQKLPEKIE